jgi:hypothetical protein
MAVEKVGGTRGEIKTEGDREEPRPRVAHDEAEGMLPWSDPSLAEGTLQPPHPVKLLPRWFVARFQIGQSGGQAFWFFDDFITAPP